MAKSMKFQEAWCKLDIPLSAPVLRTVTELGFETMKPVQATCIPLFQRNKDVAAEAVTGSGKTLSFLIPILEVMLKRQQKWRRHEVGAVVISPTRELAIQTSQVLDCFLKHIKLTQLLLVGGNSVESDVSSWVSKGGNIIIATPGRFEDLLIRQKSINLPGATKSLEVLILDEADRLLDLGFENCLNNILKVLPRQRRTGLFSATQTKEVESLVRAGLRNPVVVSVLEKTDSSVSTPSSLTNYFVMVEADKKLETLVNFIQLQPLNNKYIVFISTCACVEWFHVLLKAVFKDSNTPVSCLHGKMGKQRHKVLDTFRCADSGVLLCTDVMARGIDIPEVDWVIQFDPPSNAAAFVHRVGRTARNGKEGCSLLMLLPNEDSYIDFIKKNQRVQLKKGKNEWWGKRIGDLEGLARSLQLQDRANLDKANRAFVSFIQAYAKHECSLILRVKDLSLGLLAKGFGLLKLPKMPEMKNAVTEGFTSWEGDINSLAYSNNAREESRQKKLKVYMETHKWPTKAIRKRQNQTVAWELSKLHKDKRKEKKKLRAKEGKQAKKRKRSKMSDEDMASLARDVALISKLKKKKISQEDFDKEFSGDI